MDKPPADDNPYRATVADVPQPSAAIFTPGSPMNVFHCENLRQFRLYIHLLGDMFILIAVVILFATAWMASRGFFADEEFQMVPHILGGMGAMWFALGVATRLKQMWAAYIGMGFCYISLVTNLIRSDFLLVFLLAGILFVAHKAIGYAGPLRRAGIPLTTKPDALV